MFLNQKLGYTTKLITNNQDIDDMIKTFDQVSPNICVFDTETTGLNFITDIPFLLVFGFEKNIYGLAMDKEITQQAIEAIYRLMSQCSKTFAHNTKYDYHMMINGGYPIPENIRLADGQTIARLTNYADEQMSKSLEAMGVSYVDETSKFGGKVIRKHLHDINSRRKKVAKDAFMKKYPKKRFTMYWELLKKDVQYLKTPYEPELASLRGVYTEATYLDVNNEKPLLMLNYAYDDCVILLEWLNKAIPVLKNTDPELTVFNRECALIRPIAEMERIGFNIDIDYLLESRERIVAYQEKVYSNLHERVGQVITVGQHKVIMEIFAKKYNIQMLNCDKKSLQSIKGNEEAEKTASLIVELRTLDKWLSTYIDGALNRITEGRLYTSIDLSGAVSGRVSSNLQQQPKEPLLDDEGNELYHPRKGFITDKDYTLYFFDYSQQELRVQAYYTLLTSDGDVNLLRAYMPFGCESFITGEPFDYKIPEVLMRWNSGEWVYPDTGEGWTETDVHSATTFVAFPHLNNDPRHPEFKHYRKMGKVCNFLKNYQGGVNAIEEQLGVSPEIAKTLDDAYYVAFPNIKVYQQWVVSELTQKGYIENLYGRRYYMRNGRFFYKASNYLVQGSCADMVKQKQLELYDLLKVTKSSMVMPVHDEVIIRIHDSEEWLIPVVKSIMENVGEIPWVPIICDVEKTVTNWADKEDVLV